MSWKRWWSYWSLLVTNIHWSKRGRLVFSHTGAEGRLVCRHSKGGVRNLSLHIAVENLTVVTWSVIWGKKKDIWCRSVKQLRYKNNSLMPTGAAPETHVELVLQSSVDVLIWNDLEQYSHQPYATFVMMDKNRRVFDLWMFSSCFQSASKWRRCQSNEVFEIIHYITQTGWTACVYEWHFILIGSLFLEIHF